MSQSQGLLAPLGAPLFTKSTCPSSMSDLEKGNRKQEGPNNGITWQIENFRHFARSMAASGLAIDQSCHGSGQDIQECTQSSHRFNGALAAGSQGRCSCVSASVANQPGLFGFGRTWALKCDYKAGRRQEQMSCEVDSAVGSFVSC